MTTDKRLVLFDGECNFCNGAVLFIIDRDPAEEFVFAPLSSDIGKRVRDEHGLTHAIDSIVLVEDGRVAVESTAALRIGWRLAGLWPLLALLGYLLPRFVRDPLYRAFAKRRYKWFGRTDQCRVPTPELRKRFLATS